MHDFLHPSVAIYSLYTFSRVRAVAVFFVPGKTGQHNSWRNEWRSRVPNRKFKSQRFSRIDWSSKLGHVKGDMNMHEVLAYPKVSVSQRCLFCLFVSFGDPERPVMYQIDEGIFLERELEYLINSRCIRS